MAEPTCARCDRSLIHAVACEVRGHDFTYRDDNGFLRCSDCGAKHKPEPEGE